MREVENNRACCEGCWINQKKNYLLPMVHLVYHPCMVYQTNTLISLVVFTEDNVAGVKVGNEVSCWFRIKSGVKQGYVLLLFVWIILMVFSLGSTESQERQ